MIDKNDLMIGNYAQDADGEIYTYTWSEPFYVGFERPDDGAISCLSTKEAIPIPITPEWLERLGFELRKPCGDNGFIKWKHKDGVYLLWIEGKFWHDHWSNGLWVTSIHQLQILFFALTGERLTLNEK